MEPRFYYHRDYLKRDPDFPKNYWISIAKKHNFLIWAKSQGRKQPPIFLDESMQKLLKFIDYQQNREYDHTRVASPRHLQNQLPAAYIPFTPEDLGSLARLGLLKTCFDKVRKTGWTGVYIYTASYDAFFEFHRQCLDELLATRARYPMWALNPSS